MSNSIMTFDVCAVLLSRGLRCAVRNFGLSPSRRFTRRVHMALAEAARPKATDGAIPPVVAVFRQALATFPPTNNFSREMERLKGLMSKLRAEDIGLDPMYKDPAVWSAPNKAPCTYIELFQNQDINMSIFILAPGYKMPLHDHPYMHGLLKVVSGAVNVRSYSEHPLTSESPAAEAARERRGEPKKRRFFSQLTANLTCRENSDSCVLTPTSSNYHEIEALQLPAAFIDILAPPYDTKIDREKRRRCHYYKIINQIGSNLVEMQEIEVPEHFYCDQAPYLGPLLS